MCFCWYLNYSWVSADHRLTPLPGSPFPHLRLENSYISLKTQALGEDAEIILGCPACNRPGQG